MTATLCSEILAVQKGGGDFVVGASCLNSDGVPLQLCLTAGGKGSALRLIGDPGCQLGDFELRYRCSTQVLARSLKTSGSETLRSQAEATLALLIPGTEEEREGFKKGFVWVAVSPDRPGLAFYVETAPLGQMAGWDVAGAWLDKILPATQPAEQVLAKLREKCIAASMGLEGSTPENARAKIYFRLTERMTLDQLGLDLLQTEQMNRFLQLAMGKFGVDLDGLVMSVAFQLKDGELADLKVDLCGHCLRYDGAGWSRLIWLLCDEFKLALPPVSRALEQHGCNVAFVGLGLTREKEVRLNVYLGAPKPQGSPCADEVAAALEDGVRYLCAQQTPEGRWIDYELPVGSSDQWVTAYTGLALATYGNRLQCESALAAARQAAAWLGGERTYAAGWGYNGATGPDSDSTAMAIALFDELGIEVGADDRIFLRDRWCPHGVATFEGPEAWGDPHWDVTPVAYLGLLSEDRDKFRDSFLRGMRDSRMANGLWRSYWWKNPFYSTYLTIEVLERLGISEPASSPTNLTKLEVESAFDLACYIGIEEIRSEPAEKLLSHLRSLLGWQNADGRWPGGSNLRVTEASCEAPWDNPLGEYYTDGAGTITTGTVIRVLSRLLVSGILCESTVPNLTTPAI